MKLRSGYLLRVGLKIPKVVIAILVVALTGVAAIVGFAYASAPGGTTSSTTSPATFVTTSSSTSSAFGQQSTTSSTSSFTTVSTLSTTTVSTSTPQCTQISCMTWLLTVIDGDQTVSPINYPLAFNFSASVTSNTLSIRVTNIGQLDMANATGCGFCATLYNTTGAALYTVNVPALPYGTTKIITATCNCILTDPSYVLEVQGFGTAAGARYLWKDLPIQVGGPSVSYSTAPSVMPSVTVYWNGVEGDFTGFTLTIVNNGNTAITNGTYLALTGQAISIPSIAPGARFSASLKLKHSEPTTTVNYGYVYYAGLDLYLYVPNHLTGGLI